ncbi:MAG: tetratricopeptide repeat protein [Clostridia bacterium]|nr:tetratricopeptide repeat protein [Clostridia bacterium]
MRERVCKNCGGREYKVVGQNMVKCKFCGTLYVDEHASKEEEVLTVGAYEILRQMQFDDAVEEFDKIIALYPKSFEAHFGKALAKNRIVLYNNKRGSRNKPNFFSDQICNLSEDVDFQKATKFAPPEVAKTYTDIAKRVEKIKKLHEDKASKSTYDIILCAVAYEKAKEKVDEIYAKLSEKNSVFSLHHQTPRVKEEDVFQALQTSKVLLLVASSKEGFNEYRFLLDRYFYFIKQKKKAKTSAIVILDEVQLSDLPKDLASCKSVIEAGTISFLQDLEVMVENQKQKTTKQEAKISTVKVESVEPDKRTYVDLDTVVPADLGNYDVDNINLNDETKIKWIYLTLKNGDFASAKEFTKDLLEKDPYNAEILFAEMLADKQIKTQEEFFQNISNFKDKEKIDMILKYASKSFAEDFVDRWEKLVEGLDSEEYYETFLVYLAGYNSPNRENFVSKAESKAIETLDDSLIEKVLKCFDKNDVDRFISFYFALAQRSDDKQYYKKILELDPGHNQSNITLLLRNFKTDEDKLTYRNHEELQEVFKYLNESSRAQYISTVASLILPVAFLDLNKAEEQLDFYLSYVNLEPELSAIAKQIADSFQDMGFFKQAEKYLAIAISKDKTNGPLYWQLIKIKAHCKTDNDLIMSRVKVTQMPEWETLLELSSDEEDEVYAGIVSKSNLFKGERKEFVDDLLDLISLKSKLKDFVLRNEQILLEIEKEYGLEAKKGLDYYRLQLEPFKKYIKSLEKIKKFESFCEISEKAKVRLSALDLSLDTSVNAIAVTGVGKDLSGVYKTSEETQPEYDNKVKTIKKDKFLKRFLTIFLQFFPLLFTTLLLTISLFMPKEVYMYFSQEFLIVTLIYSVVIGMLNFTLYFIQKSKISKGWKSVFLTLFGVGMLNLVLFVLSFYLIPQEMGIKNSNELKVLLSNAKYSNFVLENDIDMEGESWQGSLFTGQLDGKGYRLTNINAQSGGFFAKNCGSIKDVEFVLQEKNYSNLTAFGAIARYNSGEIVGCIVRGKLSFETSQSLTLGGVVAENAGGKIENCINLLEINIITSGENLKIGGIAGQISGGKGQGSIVKNDNRAKISITSNGAEKIVAGGLAGNLGAHKSLDISQNATNARIVLSGTADEFVVGGLVGNGRAKSENNYFNGTIDLSTMTGKGMIGGLYGTYENAETSKTVNHSYAILEVLGNYSFGGLAGVSNGRIENCFTNASTLISQKPDTWAEARDCFSLKAGEYYNSGVQFDEEIWRFAQNSYPKLAWEIDG